MGPTTNPGRRPKSSPGRKPPRRDPADDTDAGFAEEPLPTDSVTADGLAVVGAPPHEDDDAESMESRPLALQRALRQVEAAVDADLLASMEEIETLGREEEDLHSRLEELYLEMGTVQDSLVEMSRRTRTAHEKRSETYARRIDAQATAVQRTLRMEAEELLGRQRVWQQRTEESERRLRRLKEDPALSAMIAEFRQLDARMDTLDLLPESYRGVVQAHHAELESKLKPHIEEPVREPLKPLHIAIAVAIAGGRRADGEPPRPAKLLAVLPVDFATHERAREGENDLTARFAFRVLAALSRFVVNIGAQAQPEPKDLDGLLGIELAFGDLDIPSSAADLARALRDSYADARDSRMSKVSVTTDLAFVSMSALDVLWDRAAAMQQQVAAAKPARKTKNSRRRK